MRLPAALAAVALLAFGVILTGHTPDRRVPILVYHNVAPHLPGDSAAKRAYTVSPQAFEQQMQYLRDEEFHVVPLGALVSELEGGPDVPDRAVVITLDDGWVNQYRNAVPILKRFGYTATFFVFPNPIGRDSRFMTWPELQEVLSLGMTIGSHSRTHPRMTKLATPRALADEVSGSRRTLEAHLNRPIDFFAYPFGEHPPDVEAAVRAAGYRAARGFPGGAVNGPQNIWALRSVMVTDSLANFRRQLDPRAQTGK